MATKSKDARGTWIVQYKGADGAWHRKRCGKNATAADAEVIRKLYDAQELNRRHSATIRFVDVGLKDALIEFRDTVVPRSNTGRPKSQKSIQRYKAVVENFINWLEAQNIRTFGSVTGDTIVGFFDNMVDILHRSASTVSKHRQLLINFFE